MRMRGEISKTMCIPQETQAHEIFKRLSCLILILMLHFNDAFNPPFTPTNGTTHHEMTECALYTVTIDYLKKVYKINIKSLAITTGECPAKLENLLKQGFKKNSFDWLRYTYTVNIIATKNALIDAEEQLNAPSHFDSESFPGGSKLIIDRYQLALNAIKSKKFDDANDFFGKTLHTLQATYKILKQLWNDTNDQAFGNFLGISKSIFASKALLTSDAYAFILKIQDSHVYTAILEKLENTTTKFSTIDVIVSYPAVDKYYKTHCLSIATEKHVRINIYRNSTVLNSTDDEDYGYDLCRLTGGTYIRYFNATLMPLNILSQLSNTQTIDHVSLQIKSKKLAVNIDQSCPKLFIEFSTNNITVEAFPIQLQTRDNTLIPMILVNTSFFKVYTLVNIPSFGRWNIIFPNTGNNNIRFDVRLSCASELICWSQLFTDNRNNVHPGGVELHGNAIQGHKANIVTQCFNNDDRINTLKVMLVNETGHPLHVVAKTTQQNDAKWLTKLTIPSAQSFRIKITANNKKIQRISDKLYETSQIDVSFNLTNVQPFLYYYEHTSISFTLKNYAKQPITLTLLAKDTNNYFEQKQYTIAAGQTKDDKIWLYPLPMNNSSTDVPDIQKDLVALTVTSTAGGNYDVLDYPFRTAIK
ncbi:unnamed protein product [Didymodactylos carnosus]|uniref:VWA7 N-terminal domain-containing protein n=1 Tax=Didymodactylos carnosus TaxID=1234261 RepID=A0A8S2HD93_9BILA|nr:unnamed protein product [Didymodactylos carnosus]